MSVIKCEFTKISNGGRKSFFDECTIRDKKLEENEKNLQFQKDLSVSLSNEPFLSVEKLILRNCVVEGVPDELAAQFPKITTLEIAASELNTIMKKNFKKFSNLKKIMIKNCKIQNATDSIFDNVAEIIISELSLEPVDAHGNVSNGKSSNANSIFSNGTANPSFGSSANIIKAPTLQSATAGTSGTPSGLFGASSTSRAIIRSAGKSKNMFGASSSPSNIFGASNSSQNLFGASIPQPTNDASSNLPSGIFGASKSSTIEPEAASSSTTNIFGSSAQSSNTSSSNTSGSLVSSLIPFGSSASSSSTVEASKPPQSNLFALPSSDEAIKSFFGNLVTDKPGESLLTLEDWREKCKKLEAELKSLKEKFNLQTENGKFIKGFYEDIRKFMADEDFKDFTITVKGENEEKFKVHKIFLAARSNVLADMIRNNPDTEGFNLENIPVETFKIILNYVYNDTPPDDDANLIEIYAAAGRLNIVELSNITAIKLLNKINDKNAFEILKQSNKYNNDELRQKSFEEIKKMFPDFEILDEFSYKPDKLKPLIELKKKENELFEEMMKEHLDESLKDENEISQSQIVDSTEVGDVAEIKDVD